MSRDTSTTALLAKLGVPVEQTPTQASPSTFADGVRFRLEISQLGLELLARDGVDLATSEPNAKGLAVPARRGDASRHARG